METLQTDLHFRRPEEGDASPFSFGYINQVVGSNILMTLEEQAAEALTVFAAISEERSLYRYAADKWSLRQVLGHIVDSERIFTHRAHWIARGLGGELPGFDQEIAAQHAGSDAVSWSSHVAEFGHLRRSTIALFRGLPSSAWDRQGVASGHRITVHALAFVTVGHLNHHLDIMHKRYSGAPHSV